MLCNIADLYVEIPEVGGMTPRLGAYATEKQVSPDIVIREEKYDANRWPKLAPQHVPYMDSGWLFYEKLYSYGGMMLHSSAVELDGRAYLFSGPSGMGKSTHTRLWQKEFPAARVFNDDKPVLRQLDGTWYAYGTPWCGKDGININMKVPLAGICFLRRGSVNSIRQVNPEGLIDVLLQQTFMPEDAAGQEKAVALVNSLAQTVPLWDMECTKDVGAALISYKAMSGAV
jgi:hypothetical protein